MNLGIHSLLSFVTSRKRFISEGEVSLALEYLPEYLLELRNVLKVIPYGSDRLISYCKCYDFSVSDVIVDEECEDSTNSNNGGDYWKTHQELMIYEDDYIKIFAECNYRTSYEDSCCQFCGNYGSSTCCEEPSIRAIRK